MPPHTHTQTLLPNLRLNFAFWVFSKDSNLGNGPNKKGATNFVAYINFRIEEPWTIEFFLMC